MKDRISGSPGRFNAVVSAEDFRKMETGKEFFITLIRDDAPIEDGTPYNKETVLPDDVAESIGVQNKNDGNPTPADAFRELSARAKTAYELADMVSGASIEHRNDTNNPHKVTCEKIGAVKDEEFAEKVEDIVATQLSNEGPIRASVYDVAYGASEDLLVNHGLIRLDEDDQNRYLLNVVTKEQHGADIQDAKNYADDTASDRVSTAKDDILAEIELQVGDIYRDMYTKTEVDAALAELDKELKSTESGLEEVQKIVGVNAFSEYSRTMTQSRGLEVDYATQDGKQYTLKVESYTGQYFKSCALYLSNGSGNRQLIQGGLLVGDTVVFDGNSAYKGLYVYAEVIQTEPTEATFTVKLCENNTLADRVEYIEDFVGITKPAPKVLVLGDSYSAMAGGRWITQLKSLVGLGEVVNLGVSSATMKDKVADRTAYPYSDRPVSSAGNGNNINTFGSQVEKLKRLMLGEDLDSGESKVYENSAPDIILIEGGTNDLVDDSTDNYVSQIYTVKQGVFIKSKSASATAQENKFIKIPTHYEDTDRTTFAGAMRYLYGVLHEMFRNALIFFITPCGLHYMSGSTHKYLEKGEQIKKAASLLCTPVIDWGVNGRLSMCDNVVTGTGTETDPYIYDAKGEYSVDALHPNDDGAKLLAMEVAKVLTSYNLAKYNQ